MPINVAPCATATHSIGVTSPSFMPVLCGCAFPALWVPFATCGCFSPGRSSRDLPCCGPSAGEKHPPRSQRRWKLCRRAVRRRKAPTRPDSHPHGWREEHPRERLASSPVAQIFRQSRGRRSSRRGSRSCGMPYAVRRCARRRRFLMSCQEKRTTLPPSVR